MYLKQILFLFIFIGQAFASSPKVIMAQRPLVKERPFLIQMKIKSHKGEGQNPKIVEFEKDIEIFNGKKVGISFPDQKYFVELYVSQDLPEGLVKNTPKELLYYEMKIFEVIDGKKKLMIGPEVISYLGEESIMSSVDEVDKGFEIKLQSRRK